MSSQFTHPAEVVDVTEVAVTTSQIVITIIGCNCMLSAIFCKMEMSYEYSLGLIDGLSESLACYNCRPIGLLACVN
jgi:hypothetical protein